jgi:hypothetical protein
LNLLCSTSFSKIHACNVKNLSSVLSLACWFHLEQELEHK